MKEKIETILDEAQYNGTPTHVAAEQVLELLKPTATKNNKPMMTIYFKNGMTKQVQKAVGEIIKRRVITGCAKIQCFSNENDELFLIVNVEEIVYIIINNGVYVRLTKNP